MRFEDKVVFITGGAIGFGRAFAQAFTAEGATAVIADIDDPRANQTVADLRASGAQALAVHCDVADETEVDKAVTETITTYGGIDILINNAGLHLTKYNQPFGALPRDDVRRLFDVNVIGIVNCTLACRDSMRTRPDASIINIASVAADLSLSPYGVSKLAVRGVTVALAHELSADNIRVNAISPGFIGTENALRDMPDVVDDMVDNRQLVHRLGTMNDIVTTACFLASNDARFITAETIRVSGGFPLSL
jgi:3-oxoacyl-[acyl-carrier protein] reductase